MIEPTYTDAFGNEHAVPPRTIGALTEAMGEPVDTGPLFVRPGDRVAVDEGEAVLEDGTRIDVGPTLPSELPLGYHRLHTAGEERDLIVSPGQCHLPEELQTWGWAAQLYATRSTGSWGMGDFADLKRLVEWSADRGAGMMLVNPLLAVAPVVPQAPSPYYPASRRFLNPIYLKVEEVPGTESLGGRLTEAARAGQALNEGTLIDRDRVWRLKAPILQEIWELSRQDPEFEGWCRTQGKALEDFAAWCVVCEEHGGDWRRWPARFSHPEAPGVEQFRREREDRLRFHQWLQWLCRRQLASASRSLILMQDLPIGFDPGGADAWTWQELVALDVSVGAPPDEFNTRGQDWGLPPFVPHAMRAAGYRPFVETVRSNLSTGGGLRIDHVMGLFRLFWIPSGASPSEGAYVRYPHRELLDILALESARAEAVVVGEDLGTVGPGVREELAERSILSYRLLWFEQEPPEGWPENAMASVTTHDLPTVAGLWSGDDLDEQKRYDLSPNEESTSEMRSRVGHLAGVEDDAPTEEVVAAVHRRLGRAPSRIVCATLEDATLALQRPNMPGADAERPNWSIALPGTLEQLEASPVVEELTDIFTEPS